MADLIETAHTAGNYTIWLALLDLAVLTTTLRELGPLTIFAPSDEVLTSLPPQIITTLQADPTKLWAVLAYQIVPGYYVAADLMAEPTLLTLSKRSLQITVDAGIKADAIYLTQADLLADNGVIHTTNGLLRPA